MGCKGSKDANKEQDKKINSDFDWIGIGRFDDFFNKAKSVLEIAEEIREGTEGNKESAFEVTHIDTLADPKFLDIVQVLTWSLSSGANGKIKDLDIDFISEVPYLSVNKSKLRVDTVTLWDNYSGYVKTVIESPGKLKEAVENLVELCKQATELAQSGKDDVKNSSLGLADKAKALSRLAKNCAKLPKETKKCTALQELLKTAVIDIKDSIPKIKGLIDVADEVGAKAHADNIILPGEIFDKFHKGARKPEGEAANAKPAEKKGEEKKAAKK